jgi:hypothetical protein
MLMKTELLSPSAKAALQGVIVRPQSTGTDCSSLIWHRPAVGKPVGLNQFEFTSFHWHLGPLLCFVVVCLLLLSWFGCCATVGIYMLLMACNCSMLGVHIHSQTLSESLLFLPCFAAVLSVAPCLMLLLQVDLQTLPPCRLHGHTSCR